LRARRCAGCGTMVRLGCELASARLGEIVPARGSLLNMARFYPFGSGGTVEAIPVARLDRCLLGCCLRWTNHRRPRARIWGISLYFPCISGNSPQRRVRSRLHPPPCSLRLRGRFTRSASPQRKIPPFRGVLDWAPWRLPTGDAEARGSMPPFARSVSVRHPGGPASPEYRYERGRDDYSLEPIRLPRSGSWRHPGGRPRPRR
jgi:hypothetical protein